MYVGLLNSMLVDEETSNSNFPENEEGIKEGSMCSKAPGRGCITLNCLALEVTLCH
jgi:hypothetical protein